MSGEASTAAAVCGAAHTRCSLTVAEEALREGLEGGVVALERVAAHGRRLAVALAALRAAGVMRERGSVWVRVLTRGAAHAPPVAR